MIETDYSNNSQKLWKNFGKILKNSKSKIKINKIKVNNKIVTDPLQITNEFNKFFTDIGSNLASNFDNRHRDTFRKYLNTPVLDYFCLLETSELEVKHFIEKINVKKKQLDMMISLPNF